MKGFEKQYMGVHPGLATILKEDAKEADRIRAGGFNLQRELGKLWGYVRKNDE